MCAAGAHSLGGNVGTPHGPAAPRARHKLPNNLFPVTHSWGPASTPRPPSSPWWWLSSRNEGLREFREQVGGDRKGPGRTRLGWSLTSVEVPKAAS